MLNSFLLALISILGFGLLAVKLTPFFGFYSQSVSCDVKQLALETGSIVDKLEFQIVQGIEKVKNSNLLASAFFGIVEFFASLMGFNFNVGSITIKTSTGCRVEYINVSPRNFYTIYKSFMKSSLPGIHFYGRIVPKKNEEYEEILKGNFIIIKGETVSFSFQNEIYSSFFTVDVKYSSKNELFLSDLVNKTVILVSTKKPFDSKKFSFGEYVFILPFDKLDPTLAITLMVQTNSLPIYINGLVKYSIIYACFENQNIRVKNIYNPEQMISLDGLVNILKKNCESCYIIKRTDCRADYILIVNPKLKENILCEFKVNRNIAEIDGCYSLQLSSLHYNTLYTYIPQGELGAIVCSTKKINNCSNQCSVTNYAGSRCSQIDCNCYKIYSLITTLLSDVNKKTSSNLANTIQYILPLETSAYLADYIGGKLVIVFPH